MRNYVRSLLGDWVFFAQHLGFPNYLIEEIQCTYSYNHLTQIQAFLRECLIPDCGDERTKVIMSGVKEVVQVPKGNATPSYLAQCVECYHLITLPS